MEDLIQRAANMFLRGETSGVYTIRDHGRLEVVDE